jgi:hypothetical protein
VVLLVPHVPTCGAAGSRALLADLFEPIISVADTGRFLPYNKDKRWFVGKDGYILVPEIIHTPELTVVPALATGDAL